MCWRVCGGVCVRHTFLCQHNAWSCNVNFMLCWPCCTLSLGRHQTFILQKHIYIPRDTAQPNLLGQIPLPLCHVIALSVCFMSYSSFLAVCPTLLTPTFLLQPAFVESFFVFSFMFIIHSFSHFSERESSVVVEGLKPCCWTIHVKAQTNELMWINDFTAPAALSLASLLNHSKGSSTIQYNYQYSVELHFFFHQLVHRTMMMIASNYSESPKVNRLIDQCVFFNPGIISYLQK